MTIKLYLIISGQPFNVVNLLEEQIKFPSNISGQLSNVTNLLSLQKKFLTLLFYFYTF